MYYSQSFHLIRVESRNIYITLLQNSYTKNNNSLLLIKNIIMINFDHFEIHVKDSLKYVDFLQKLFGNGRYKKISNNNTFMFVSPDQIHIEIKENKKFIKSFDLEDSVGVCLPCLRMKGAKEHLLQLPEIQILKEIKNPDGACYFFKDYENIDWHFKDYDCLDIYINI